MTGEVVAGQLVVMDIKLHPDAKKLLDDINSRRRGHIVKAEQSREGSFELRRGETKGKADSKLSRADLEGRGGPL